MIKQFAAGLGLVLTLSAPAFASEAILFDGNGTDAGGELVIGSWDWFFSNAAAKNAISANAGSDPIGSGLLSDYEVTFVTGFDEKITDFSQSASFCVATDCSFSQTIQLGDPATQTNSFFEVYWDDTINSGSLSGMGFNDSTLILSGAVSSASGIFRRDFSFTDTNGNGEYDAGVDPLNTVVLDQSANKKQRGRKQATRGQGRRSQAVNTQYQNFDYIKTDITNLVFDLDLNTSNILPFNETNPSQAYWNGSSFGVPELGGVHGASGPDIIFQTAIYNSFNTFKEVSEPTTILLLALGLLLLATSNRRRQQTIQLDA